MPQGINYSNEEIIKACSGGLISPYRKNEMYANVFCFICNNETYSQDNTCERAQPIISLRNGQRRSSFFGLIDSRLLPPGGFTDKPVLRARIPLACDKQKVSIFCNVSTEMIMYLILLFFLNCFLFRYYF